MSVLEFGNYKFSSLLEQQLGSGFGAFTQFDYGSFLRCKIGRNFFLLLSLTTATLLYLLFIYLQFKTESRIISKAPAGCLGSPISLG